MFYILTSFSWSFNKLLAFKHVLIISFILSITFLGSSSCNITGTISSLILNPSILPSGVFIGISISVIISEFSYFSIIWLKALTNSNKSDLKRSIFWSKVMGMFYSTKFPKISIWAALNFKSDGTIFWYFSRNYGVSEYWLLLIL